MRTGTSCLQIPFPEARVGVLRLPLASSRNPTVPNRWPFSLNTCSKAAGHLVWRSPG